LISHNYLTQKKKVIDNALKFENLQIFIKA